MLRNRAGPTALSLWFCKIGFLLAENQHGCSARFSLSLSLRLATLSLCRLARREDHLLLVFVNGVRGRGFITWELMNLSNIWEGEARVLTLKLADESFTTYSPTGQDSESCLLWSFFQLLHNCLTQARVFQSRCSI